MNKIININPELYKTSRTKKNQTPIEFKIKVPKQPNQNNNKSIKRKNLLNFIRAHQENNKILTNSKQTTDKLQETHDILQGDFDQSMKYLMDMTNQLEKTKLPQHVNNHTLKNHIGNEHENVSLVFPEFHDDNNNLQPKYGCLKGGTLPTYRQYHKNQTHKISHIINSNDLAIPQQLKSIHSNLTSVAKQPPPSSRYKKILKRTFRIGKSPANRMISVLVSNKTIRNRISNSNIELKQTPMLEVRRYLIKHGLIKVGTTCPPDILRKMFESASLTCGDITNHNSETLLYNFLNSDKKNLVILHMYIYIYK